VQVDGFYSSQFPGTIVVTAVPNTVTICHRPSLNSTRTYAITVSGCALADHLAHGDLVGACTAARLGTSNEDDATALSLLVYPNPATDMVNISFTSDQEENYTMTLVDLTGRVISAEANRAMIGENNPSLHLQDVTPGIYFLVINKGNHVIQARIVKE